MGEQPRPTLDEIRTTWPATVDVTTTARGLGVSRAHLYEQIKVGTAPVRTIKVGKRVMVVTSSILRLLDGLDLDEQSKPAA
jgi:predicted DNA-binding transcriptional regulator AlpA